MTIPFAGDFALPVSQALMSILDQELVRSGMVLKGKSSLVFNFRSYCQMWCMESGGVPV